MPVGISSALLGLGAIYRRLAAAMIHRVTGQYSAAPIKTVFTSGYSPDAYRAAYHSHSALYSLSPY